MDKTIKMSVKIRETEKLFANMKVNAKYLMSTGITQDEIRALKESIAISESVISQINTLLEMHGLSDKALKDTEKMIIDISSYIRSVNETIILNERFIND